MLPLASRAVMPSSSAHPANLPGTVLMVWSTIVPRRQSRSWLKYCAESPPLPAQNSLLRNGLTVEFRRKQNSGLVPPAPQSCQNHTPHSGSVMEASVCISRVEAACSSRSSTATRAVSDAKQGQATDSERKSPQIIAAAFCPWPRVVSSLPERSTPEVGDRFLGSLLDRIGAFPNPGATVTHSPWPPRRQTVACRLHRQQQIQPTGRAAVTSAYTALEQPVYGRFLTARPTTLAKPQAFNLSRCVSHTNAPRRSGYLLSKSRKIDRYTSSVLCPPEYPS
jgi:hypothetical protein